MFLKQTSVTEQLLVTVDVHSFFTDVKVTESSESFVKATVRAVKAASGRNSASCMRLHHCVLMDPHPLLVRPHLYLK